MKDKKVIFMGTPEFAVPILEMLVSNTNVVLVVTQPDKEVGRKRKITFSPIKKFALENNIEVFQPHKIREEYGKIIETKADIIITCAYGQIIPDIILNSTPYGSINVHASLLPKLRGGAPIHHAIIDGYDETGITIMYMDSKMDSGDIISQEKIKIEHDLNVGMLHDKLSIMGKDLLKDTLPSIFNKTNKRIKQDESLVTYGLNIKRSEEQIDFNKPAKDVYNKIRGLNPWPLANTIINGLETKIIESKIVDIEKGIPGEIVEITKDSIIVKCLDKSVEITKLKPFGKKIMSTKDYLNGIKKEELLGKVLKYEV